MVRESSRSSIHRITSHTRPNTERGRPGRRVEAEGRAGQGGNGSGDRVGPGRAAMSAVGRGISRV